MRIFALKINKNYILNLTNHPQPQQTQKVIVKLKPHFGEHSLTVIILTWPQTMVLVTIRLRRNAFMTDCALLAASPGGEETQG